MRNIAKKIIPKVKRDISVFLTSEEGKILKKDVVETAVILGIIGGAILQTEEALAAVHYNYLHNSGGEAIQATVPTAPTAPTALIQVMAVIPTAHTAVIPATVLTAAMVSGD